jgi:hypothetical protein
MPADQIQETVIAQAAKLGLSAYAVAQLTRGLVSENHVRCYMTRQKSMGSHKLQHVLRALNLKIQEG